MIDNTLLIPGTAIAVFTIAAVLTRVFASPESRFRILDLPNERSLHTRPTPRTGGVAMAVGITAGSLTWLLLGDATIPAAVWWLIGLSGLTALVSFIDDRRHLPVVYRITVHFVAAGLLLHGGLTSGAVRLPGMTWEMAGWLATVVTILYVVWMTNLYNFMDGMDGFAAGMAVIGFGALALFGWQSGNFVFTALNLIVASAASGFLVFNFPPAKIFMGDTGSSLLGFLAAGMSLWGDSDDILPLWMSMLVFSPFIVDASVTLIRRLLKSERVWQAHKSHYYQRLVQMGWGHRKTALAGYLLMMACAGSALAALHVPVAMQWTIIGFWVLVYVVMMAWVDRVWSRWAQSA